MKKCLLLAFVLSSVCALAGDRGKSNLHPIHSSYGVSAYEFIFSFGEVKNAGQALDNVVRFTPVFNPQHQSHYNFSNGVGLYTGFGIRNVGFINRFSVPSEAEVTVKQRAYSFGVPLAVKLGNMEKGMYIALGVEAELMFHYKEKILQGDHNTKSSSWFSSDVNQFNPSLFADIRFHNGTFFRFRYYLDDFLKEKNMDFYLPVSGTKVNYTPTQSTLFYFSIGTAIKIRSKRHVTKQEA